MYSSVTKQAVVRVPEIIAVLVGPMLGPEFPEQIVDIYVDVRYPLGSLQSTQCALLGRLGGTGIFQCFQHGRGRDLYTMWWQTGSSDDAVELMEMQIPVTYHLFTVAFLLCALALVD